MLLISMDVGTFRSYPDVPTDDIFYVVLPGKFEQNR